MGLGRIGWDGRGMGRADLMGERGRTDLTVLCHCSRLVIVASRVAGRELLIRGVEVLFLKLVFSCLFLFDGWDF